MARFNSGKKQRPILEKRYSARQRDKLNNSVRAMRMHKEDQERKIGDREKNVNTLPILLGWLPENHLSLIHI